METHRGASALKNVNEKYQSRMTGGALPLKERKNSDLRKSIYSLPLKGVRIFKLTKMTTERP
jgi:hypothetical protein